MELIDEQPDNIVADNKNENYEDYVCAMRFCRIQASLKEESQRGSMSTPSTSVRASKSGIAGKGFSLPDDYHTKILASLVPDEIIYNVDDYDYRTYDSTILLGDVSGFSDFSETFNRSDKGGPSKLTQILNSYIGSMVQEILSHNGDVLKFSGDAFLALWKTSENYSMQDIVHEALDCAIIIQKSYGTYVTDVGITLRVKLAISAGLSYFSAIGNAQLSHYCVVGQPVWDAKGAEYKSTAGDILVTNKAWEYVGFNEYIAEAATENMYKLLGFGTGWRIPVRYETDNSMAKNVQMVDENIYKNISMKDSDIIVDNFLEESSRYTNEYLLRPSVNDASKMRLKDKLRKFMISPILRSIDNEEPLEYLTEMRQIVVLFINIIVRGLGPVELIKIVDEAYKIVCGVVIEMQGCVNKISLFDKDLMLLVIFGLRGYKHDLECQIGLRCAGELRPILASLPSVISASIGVTTGMTYCGVVGHALRREYTVIGSVVNKAARLMVAYPDKVTCCSETFLYSKLEAQHFVMQKYIPLKGITNVGPIYEYKEKSLLLVTTKVNPYPILGRSNELTFYIQMLGNFLKDVKNKNNMDNTVTAVHVHGDAKQGKTRLIDEYIYITPNYLPLHRVKLTRRDKKRPYLAMLQILSFPMGFHINDGVRVKETKIRGFIKDANVHSALYLFNPVFSVKFKPTELHRKMTSEQRKAVLPKLFKYLISRVFPAVWVIAIDDAEFLDDESWHLLQIMIESNLLFIIFTTGSRRPLKKSSGVVIKHHKVKHIQLGTIDKWYLLGLVCQLLNVYGISPELERVIQLKSNGNPGWIESFLLNLMQTGDISVQSIKEEELGEKNLVVPPIFMMRRLTETPSELLTDENLIVEKEEHQPPAVKKESSWQRNSQARESMTRKNEISVCIISPNFNIDEIGAELKMDASILKIFDSLTSYEQLLLKCGGVIGDLFSRDMLIYVISTPDMQATELAIKRLFEIRVLACAHGEFTHGNKIPKYKPQTTDPEKEKEVQCYCSGLLIIHDESNKNLPKYAFCGYIRFVIPMFRETIYSLLTEKQKTEFHTRAIRYLEKETRRCPACGEGFFNKLVWKRHDQEVRSRQALAQSYHETEQEMSNFAEVLNAQVARHSYRVSKSGRASKNNSVNFMGLDMTFDVGSISSFDSANFAECQCDMIIITMYTQLLRHCRGAGQYEKMLDILLDYADMSIGIGNIHEALNVLYTALNFLDKNNVTLNTKWKLKIVRIQINILIGRAHIEVGELNDAAKILEISAKSFGYHFPKNKLKNRILVRYQYFKNFVTLIPKLSSSGVVTEEEANYCIQAANCLSLMCIIFMELKMWNKAELAALWSLNEYLETNFYFKGLCKSCACFIVILLHKKKLHYSIQVEQFAIDLCTRLSKNIEQDELINIAKLYIAVFINRFYRAELENAVTIGFIGNRISTSVSADALKIQLLPHLANILIIKERISDAVILLYELKKIAEQLANDTGIYWFYYVCVNFHLDTGYKIITYEKCVKFCQRPERYEHDDLEAEMAFFASMLVRYARTEEWEFADSLYVKTDFTAVYRLDTPFNIIILLRLVEAIIILLVHMVNSHDIIRIPNLYKTAKQVFKVIKEKMKGIDVTRPRYLHMKAYFRKIEHDDHKVAEFVQQAKEISVEQGNLLELSWINHSEKVWKKALTPEARDLWKIHTDPSNLLDWHLLDSESCPLIHFSLPIPKIILKHIL